MCTNRSPGNSTNRFLPHASAPASTWPSTSAADSANRPCGLPARTTRPEKVSVSSSARRWRVCPSGIARRARQWRELAGLLVRRELGDPAYVPLLPTEGLGEEDLDEPGHVLERVHAPADRDHVGVVVLTGQPGGLLRPHERSTD